MFTISGGFVHVDVLYIRCLADWTLAKTSLLKRLIVLFVLQSRDNIRRKQYIFTAVAQIHHQDAVSKMWYTGFGGFADHYGLRPLLFGCAAIWMIASACRVYIQLFVRRYIVNKKYLLCRICSLFLYAVGTVIWIICVLKPWKFMWTIGISVTVVIYGLAIAASLALAKYFEGR